MYGTHSRQHERAAWREELQNLTCRPLYYEALTKYTEGDATKIRLFAAGFIHGECEKVFLGACRAAMFRPSEADWHLVEELVQDACRHYGLKYYTLATEREMWVCRERHLAEIAMNLNGIEVNSPQWHAYRGALCGVPTHEIDTAFHERAGYRDSAEEPVPSLSCG